MPGEFKRLFVGNLPSGATEKDLESEFNAYGEVQRVELKRKENLVDPENPLLFAFVNINIVRESLDLCLDEFSRQKFRGRLLTVSVARESFLDRLKREREEANTKQGKVLDQLETSEPTPQKSATKLPQIGTKKESSSSSESSESEEDDVEIAPTETSPAVREYKENQDDEDEDTLFTKKRASASLYNGKIKIQSINNEPIHVITKNQKNERQLDEQAKKADQKRKQSQNKMKNQYTQQKLAIQNALADVDTNKRKRIVFDDEDTANCELSQENHATKNKLFGDDEENEEDVTSYEKDFKIKSQFLGRGGDKLLKLQSKYNLDRRFQLDERFVENEEDAENNENVKDDSKEGSDERSWQLGIIEQVVGRKFETLSAPDKKKLKKTILRFDPAKEEHQKFLQDVAKVAETFKSDKRKKEESKEVEVSKEQFYSINDLTKSLKSRRDGFSLISMFGQADEDTEKLAGDRERFYEEKVLTTGKPEQKFLNNAFKYDSSDSEDEAELDLNSTPKAKVIEKSQKNLGGGATTKQGIRIETFFICGEDDRLKEGRTFFKPVKTKDGEPEDYDKVKDRLRQIINKKIVKSRRHDKKFQNKNKFKRK